MKKYRESKTLLEVRKIKEDISKEASKAGMERYYLGLNKDAGKLLKKFSRRRPKVKKR